MPCAPLLLLPFLLLARPGRAGARTADLVAPLCPFRAARNGTFHMGAASCQLDRTVVVAGGSTFSLDGAAAHVTLHAPPLNVTGAAPPLDLVPVAGAPHNRHFLLAHLGSRLVLFRLTLAGGRAVQWFNGTSFVYDLGLHPQPPALLPPPARRRLADADADADPDSAALRFAGGWLGVGGSVLVATATTTDVQQKAKFNGTDLVFRHNSANDGGAVAVFGLGSATLTRVTFVDNAATAVGGGVAVRGSRASAELQDCRWVNNTAGRFGGGLSVNHGAQATLRGASAFESNTAVNGRGGGLFFADDGVSGRTSINIYDAQYRFHGNSARLAMDSSSAAGAAKNCSEDGGNLGGCEDVPVCCEGRVPTFVVSIGPDSHVGCMEARYEKYDWYERCPPRADGRPQTCLASPPYAEGYFTCATVPLCCAGFEPKGRHAEGIQCLPVNDDDDDDYPVQCLPGSAYAWGQCEIVASAGTTTDALHCAEVVHVEECQPGTYVNALALEANGDADFVGCPIPCPAGRFARTLARRSFADECSGCEPGAYCLAGSVEPVPCPAGRFGSAFGLTNASCSGTCPPGSYCPEGLARHGIACPAGKYSESTGAKTLAACQDCPTGTFSESQGSSSRAGCVDCAAGKASDRLGAARAADCVSCMPGRFRGDDSAAIACQACSSGRFSAAPGATVCLACEPGRFRNGSGSSANATRCEICGGNNLHQPQEGQSSCTACASGRTPAPDKRLCVRPDWTLASDCGAGQYLDDRDPDKMNHSCVECIDGANCAAGTAAVGSLGTLFGWWRNATSELVDPRFGTGVFIRCPATRACLGASNPLFVEQFFDLVTGRDLAEMGADTPARCNVEEGYLNGSRACSACRPGYTRSRVSECSKCMEEGAAKALWLCAVFFAVVFVVAAVRWKVRAVHVGKQTYHSEKRIIVSNLQVISVLMSFSVNWPNTLVGVMDTVGAPFSGSSVVAALDCTDWLSGLRTLFRGPHAAGDHSYATVMYASVLLIALAPFVIAAVASVYWLYCARKNKLLLCMRKKAGHKSDPKDNFVVTCVFIFYLMYPSLSRCALELMDCISLGPSFALALYAKQVGASFHFAGEATMAEARASQTRFLSRDIEEQCYTGRHLQMVIFVGSPMVLLYMVGLPAAATLVLWRNRGHLVVHRQQAIAAARSQRDVIRAATSARAASAQIKEIEMRNLFKYGMLYSGFREERWYW